jgi:hypothetical protein
MFITKVFDDGEIVRNPGYLRWYSDDGTFHIRGPVLVLFGPNPFGKKDPLPLYARGFRLVYYTQLGHYLMGRARFGGGPYLTLSGSYGGDGLPLPLEDLTDRQRSLLTPVPTDLTALYWQGGGWNSAGKEAPEMERWAMENWATLTRKR